MKTIHIICPRLSVDKVNIVQRLERRGCLIHEKEEKVGPQYEREKGELP